jgi:hypothetical protein
MMFTMRLLPDGAAEVADFASGVPGPVQITSGPGGDLYIMTILGALFRLRYTGEVNAAPVASTGTTTGTVTDTPAPTTGDSRTPAGTGRILREWWLGVGGDTVVDLTKSDAFQGKPSGSDLLPVFETPLQFNNDYGQRIRGYLHPQVSGEYRFWISADDSAELWLSTDADPANKQRIASVPAWTLTRQFDKFAEQQSGGVILEAGKKYYVEVLHKDADQKDNLSVAWQIPGAERTIIEGQYLSPFAPVK